MMTPTASTTTTQNKMETPMMRGEDVFCDDDDEPAAAVAC
jgi:hypothetical protein